MSTIKIESIFLFSIKLICLVDRDFNSNTCNDNEALCFALETLTEMMMMMMMINAKAIPATVTTASAALTAAVNN